MRDAQGTPVPVFTPGVSEVWNFQATRGATIDINDDVDLPAGSLDGDAAPDARPRHALRDGAQRRDRRHHDGGLQRRSCRGWPRATTSQGNGKTVLYGTYGHYSGKYSQVQFAVNTNVGRPSEVDYVYSGPAGSGRRLRARIRPRQLHARWSSPTSRRRTCRSPTACKSPLTREFTLGIGRELGSRGHAKATYAWRTTSNFVEDFVDTDAPASRRCRSSARSRTGCTTTRDALYRDYQAMILQSGYRLRDNVTINGHYTLQLRNHGNFAGEAANQPGIPSIYGNFPEIFGPALDRLMPEGRLDNFQRHKLRVYGDLRAVARTVRLGGSRAALARELGRRLQPTRRRRRDAGTAARAATRAIRRATSARRRARPCSSASAARTTSRATA